MDIHKFSYEIDPEVIEEVLISKKTEENDFDTSEEEEDFFYEEGNKNKKVKKRVINTEERDPKPETYYITYHNVEFVILAKKLGFLEEYQRIVHSNHGDFFSFEDELYDSRDAEAVVEILKEKFSEKGWFLTLFAKAIKKYLSQISSFDDKAISFLKEQFFMLEEETLYQGISYLVNHMDNL